MDFKMRFIIKVWSIALFILVLCTMPVFAATEDADKDIIYFSEKEILKPNVGNESLSLEQINFLQNNLDLATKRAKKDVDYLISKSVMDMNNNMTQGVTVF